MFFYHFQCITVTGFHLFIPRLRLSRDTGNFLGHLASIQEDNANNISTSASHLNKIYNPSIFKHKTNLLLYLPAILFTFYWPNFCSKHLFYFALPEADYLFPLNKLGWIFISLNILMLYLYDLKVDKHCFISINIYSHHLQSLINSTDRLRNIR